MIKGDRVHHDWVAMRREHTRVEPQMKRRPGWKLRQWRLQNQVTQTDAAKMFGCSQPVLSQYERGTRDPHGDGIVASIARITGVRW